MVERIDDPQHGRVAYRFDPCILKCDKRRELLSERELARLLGNLQGAVFHLLNRAAQSIECRKGSSGEAGY